MVHLIFHINIMNNGKKEFAENGEECDYLSRRSRRFHKKRAGKAKRIKKRVNKRFRKALKNENLL